MTTNLPSTFPRSIVVSPDPSSMSSATSAATTKSRRSSSGRKSPTIMSEVLFFDASDQLVEMASNNNSDLFLEHIPKNLQFHKLAEKGIHWLTELKSIYFFSPSLV